MKIIVGTRGSRLAIAQCDEVVGILAHAYPMHAFTKKIIQTKGDKIQHLALDQMQDKGIFVKEIEQQLLDGSIDMAVHSLKDMPSLLEPGLCFTNTLLREDSRDVLILNTAKSLADVPAHGKIGTGSKRRKFQLLTMRRDLEVVGIRGNIETRIQKMKDQQLDGIILAAAGLHRLALQTQITAYLNEVEMVSACGQGAIAVELRSDRTDLLDMVNALCDPSVQREVDVERRFLTHLQGGCHVPLGARCHIQEDKVILHALYGKEDGSQLERITLEKGLNELDTIAVEAAEKLRCKLHEQ